MIEFRWLDAPMFISDRALPEGIDGYIPRKEILQYRIMKNPLELGIQEPIYGEWFDVPTVKYEHL